MKNWKTTTAGLVAGLGLIFTTVAVTFGFAIPEWADMASKAIASVGVFLAGFFSNDAPVIEEEEN